MQTTITAVSKNNENLLAKITSALERVEPDRATLVTSNPSSGALEKIQKHTRINALDAKVIYAFAGTVENDRLKAVKLKNATLIFQGRIYDPRQTDPYFETIFDKTEPETSAETLLEKTEGEFSFSILKSDSVIAGRDLAGVQPLYYGENKQIAALATSRKALWTLGIAEPKSFPPGHIARISRTGFEFKPVRTLQYLTPRKISMEKAVTELQNLLERAVSIRAHDLKKVAIAFSGGVDSSLIAAIAKKCNIEIHLIHVSLENHLETQTAINAAKELNLPIHIALFKKSDVAASLPKVVELIEEPDPVKTAIGIPFYWVAQQAAQEGFDVLLAGQGADELFGGYQRYVESYMQKGNDIVRKIMFNDVINLHESNIERDVKICNYHNVELRLPFASFPLVTFAMQLPTELKIENKKDTPRKLVLREVARKIGLSQEITQKRKKAVQYSTGVNDVLKKLAQEEGLSTSEFIGKQYNHIERLFRSKI
jgi:asparagine synthase (glutamine-hydrolysing)